jgi:ribonuclease-3
LSRARAALVKEPTLAAIALALGVDAHLILGAGELRTGGAQRAAILADAVEALIGAVLLDGGEPAAEAVIDLMFAEQLESLPDAAALKDPKTTLQEWLQGRGLPLPSYEVITVHGRDHEQTFVVECQVREKNVQTTGRGQSRRRAEQDAAASMLSVLKGDGG